MIIPFNIKNNYKFIKEIKEDEALQDAYTTAFVFYKNN